MTNTMPALIGKVWVKDYRIHISPATYFRRMEIMANLRRSLAMGGEHQK